MADIKHVNLNAGTGIEIEVDATGKTLTISAEASQEKLDALESKLERKIDSAIKTFESRLTSFNSRLTLIEKALGISGKNDEIEGLGKTIGKVTNKTDLANYIRDIVFDNAEGLIDFGTVGPITDPNESKTYGVNNNPNARIYLKFES